MSTYVVPPCLSRGIGRSVDCHVSSGNHPVKLSDQQDQAGLAQLLRRIAGMIARSSIAKQFNMGKCRVLWLGAEYARACQYEPPRGCLVYVNFLGTGVSSSRVQSASRPNWLFFMHVERCRSVWMGGLATVFSRVCMSVPSGRLAKERQRTRRSACRAETGPWCFLALSSCCLVVPGAWNSTVFAPIFLLLGLDRMRRSVAIKPRDSLQFEPPCLHSIAIREAAEDDNAAGNCEESIRTDV
jgi:hypothetical protein